MDRAIGTGARSFAQSFYSSSHSVLNLLTHVLSLVAKNHFVKVDLWREALGVESTPVYLILEL
jgi:hypothetical protein